jgi:hypothetical protein
MIQHGVGLLVSREENQAVENGTYYAGGKKPLLPLQINAQWRMM